MCCSKPTETPLYSEEESSSARIDLVVGKTTIPEAVISGLTRMPPGDEATVLQNDQFCLPFLIELASQTTVSRYTFSLKANDVARMIIFVRRNTIGVTSLLGCLAADKFDVVAQYIKEVSLWTGNYIAMPSVVSRVIGAIRMAQRSLSHFALENNDLKLLAIIDKNAACTRWKYSRLISTAKETLNLRNQNSQQQKRPDPPMLPAKNSNACLFWCLRLFIQ